MRSEYSESFDLTNQQTKSSLGLLLISVFYVVFFPTSFRGEIITYMWMIKNLSATAIALYITAKNKLYRKPLLTTIILLSWLAVLTITTKALYADGDNDFHVAWAALSGFIPTLMFWCTCIKTYTIDISSAKRILHGLTIVLLIWGWGLVFQITPIVNFTYFFFSQLNDNMFNNMITIRGKPVMSFGTHSMSAFFLMLFFFLHCVEIKEGKGDYRNYIYMALLFALVIPMRSNTAVFALAGMLVLLLWTNNTHLTRIIAFATVTVGVFFAITQGELFDFVLSIIRSSNYMQHGIAGRYLSGIFTNNIKIALNYVGVGFLRSDSEVFRMNDSGIIYLFTQGNVLAVVLAYKLMYGFIKTNVRRYSLITFGVFFTWEFIATSTFISVKMIFAQVLSILIINSFCSKKEENEVYD